MTDLAGFLLARIAEDEAAADTTHYQYCGVNDDMGPTECDCGIPARLLAECDAKRKIIELHERDHYESTGLSYDYCGHCSEVPYGEWPCPTLRLLALPYADHPDYDESWRP